MAFRLCVTTCVLIASAVSMAQTGTSTIRGRMWDAQVDRPVAGVVVTLSPGRVEAVTDFQGRYAFVNLPAGSYRMEIDPPTDYAVTQDHDFKNASIGAGESVSVDWPLDPVVEVTGIVKNTLGGLMARVPVHVEVLNSQKDTETITDGVGRFGAIVPAHCGIHVKISSNGETSDHSIRHEIEGEARTLEISLHRGASVSGYVVDAQNRRVANAHVQLRPRGFARADEHGRFSIVDLMPGDYTVVVTPPENPDDATLPAKEQIVLRLDLASGENVTELPLLYNPTGEQTISGRVTDMDGAPLAHANMSWGSPEHGWAEFTQTREDGTYAVRGLIDGDYHLVNVEYGGEQYDSDSIEGMRRAAIGSTGVDFKIKLAPPKPPVAPFEIRVVSATDKSPITSFEVMYQEGIDQLFDAEKFNLTGFLQGPPRHRINDSRGVFSTGKRVGAAYSLAVRAPGYGLWVGLVDKDSESFTVPLEPQSWVSGRATDRDGNPAAGAVIMYHSIFGYRMPDADEMAVLGKTDGNGRFRLGGLPSSEIQLMFIHADHADTTVRVTPDRFNPPDEDVVLPRAGVLTGRIYLDGQLLTESSGVDYWDPETNPGYGIGGHIQGPDGTYRVGRLPAGDGRAKATIFPTVASKRQAQEVTVTIVEGESTIVDFRFTSAK